MCLSQWRGPKRCLSVSLGSMVGLGIVRSLLDVGISVLCLYLCVSTCL